LEFVGSSWPFTPLIRPLVLVVVLVVVAALVAVAISGRNDRSRRVGPAGYFLFGLSLLFLGVTIVSAGVGVHAVSELVGPAPGDANFGYFPDSGDPGFPPCSDTSSSSSTSPITALPSATSTTLPAANTTTPGDTPCVDFGDSGSTSSIDSPASGLSDLSPNGFGDSGGVVSFSDELSLSSSNSTNHSISAAVAAALFAIAAFLGYALVWPRACLLVARSDLDDGLEQFALGYAYLVAALAAISLVVFLPVAVDNVFRAIAPGINQTSGHAPGGRGLVTFLALSALAAAVLVYHLRLARDLRDPTGFDLDGPDGDEDPHETADDDASPGPEESR